MMVEVPWEITQEVYMQELWFLHSAYPLMLVNICIKFHDASLYGLKVIDRTRWRHDFVRDKVQREITQKIKMQELLFLHSARRLMLVDICMKFHDASLYGLKVIERTQWRQDFVRDKVQREITQKIKMQKLPFLHSARRLMLVNICMKFHDASLYGFKVIERTRWRHDFVRDKVQREITKKNINARVTVLALCTSSNVD